MDRVAMVMPIGDQVPAQTWQSTMTVGIYAATKGVQVGMVGMTERTLIDNARNTLVDQFLKTDLEWIFWMDSDMTFPKETLVRLLQTAKAKDAKMVTGIYYQRVGKHWPVLWSRNPELENGRKVAHKDLEAYNQNEYMGTFTLPGPECKEPFKVHAAGFGCTLIHREVLERMDSPWFMFIKGKCSEDFYFFVNAQKLGYELWADPSLDLGHIGNAPIITRQDCYRWLEENNAGLEPIKEK